MDWTCIQDLVAVADTGSLSGAARRLGVSQPTIGRRIEQLERDLNASLFNRSPKGLVLTDTGEQVLVHAQRMAEEALAVERIASGSNLLLEGVVRVTLTDMLGVKWLPQKLPEFYARYPHLRLEVVVDNRTLDLVRREADIAIRFARPQQLDLVTRQSVMFSYGLYAADTYLRQHAQPVSLRDFRRHSFISYDETVFHIPELKRLEKLVGQSQITHRSTSLNGVLEAVSQGIGIGILGNYQASRVPGLVQIMPDKFNVTFTAWVVTHADIYRKARIRAVFDFLYEKLAADEALFR